MHTVMPRSASRRTGVRIYSRQQRAPVIRVESVGSGNEPVPSGSAGRLPAESGLVVAVFDGVLEAGELGESVDRAAGGGELEVDQSGTSSRPPSPSVTDSSATKSEWTRTRRSARHQAARSASPTSRR
jgi:hypothetical protein